MFKELLNTDENERAVSPVIGVILMVAITVILAAVIGAFVLQLGDSVATDQPQASFGFEFEGNSTIEITHQGGDEINNDQLRVTLANSEVWQTNEAPSVDSATGWSKTSGGVIATGDTLNTTNTTANERLATPGATLRVIWVGDDGSGSTLASRELPN